MLVRFNRPWEFVELSELRNSEDTAPPDLSVIPQRFTGGGFVERIRSWPLLERNKTKRYSVSKFSVESYEKPVL